MQVFQVVSVFFIAESNEYLRFVYSGSPSNPSLQHIWSMSQTADEVGASAHINKLSRRYCTGTFVFILLKTNLRWNLEQMCFFWRRLIHIENRILHACS